MQETGAVLFEDGGFDELECVRRGLDCGKTM
jgi:hypothetical protein